MSLRGRVNDNSIDNILSLIFAYELRNHIFFLLGMNNVVPGNDVEGEREKERV